MQHVYFNSKETNVSSKLRIKSWNFHSQCEDDWVELKYRRANLHKKVGQKPCYTAILKIQLLPIRSQTGFPNI